EAAGGRGPVTRVRLAGQRTFHSLRVRNYRLFFFSQLISLSGTWMQTTAQSWLVLDLTGKSSAGFALGLMLALQFLPLLLFGVWGRLIGPAIAGISIHAIGISPSFLLNAISFIPVVAALRAMRTRELVRHERLPRSKGQIREGLRYVWREPVLRSTLLLVTVVAT